MNVSRFNIRIYILLLDTNKTSVLLSDEIIGGKYFTNFPGGGLEYGEGVLDYLHREAREESFRCLAPKNINIEEMSFPIDREVVSRLCHDLH